MLEAPAPGTALLIQMLLMLLPNEGSAVPGLNFMQFISGHIVQPSLISGLPAGAMVVAASEIKSYGRQFHKKDCVFFLCLLTTHWLSVGFQASAFRMPDC